MRPAINLALPRRFKAWGDSSLRLEVCQSRSVTHPTRSMLLIPRPAEVWPIYWIQQMKSTVFVTRPINRTNTQLKCKNSKLSKRRFSSIWPIDRTLIRCYHPVPEWTWEWWHWRGISHSQKIQHYWNLTIRLFSVICRRVIGGGKVLPLCREVVGVFYSPKENFEHYVTTFWNRMLIIIIIIIIIEL